MAAPPSTPYLQREALKKAMWEANERAALAESRAKGTNDMRDWEAAYDAAKALRKACDAWAAFGKPTVRETTP